MVRLRGFSLLELMVVVAIMGILMALAAPAVTEWLASQRVRETAADLHMSLVRARNEAISRNFAVAVTPEGGNWASGWSIANPNFSGQFIEQHADVPGATISGAGTITFTQVGRLQGAAVAIKITAEGTGLARCITIDTAGRPKVIPIAASATCS